MRRYRAALAGAALSALCLWLALRKVDWVLFGRSLKSFNWAYFPLMAGLVLCDLAARSLRWRRLLPEGPRNRLGLLFRLETIGLALNNILPFRLGELGRTYLGAQELEVPFVTVLATIVVERVLDGLSLLALFIFLGDWGEGQSWALGLRRTAEIGLVLGTAGLFAVVGLEDLSEKWPRLGGLIARRPRLAHFIEQIKVGTRSLRSWRSAWGVFGLGLALWIFDAALMFTAGRAFGIDALTFRRSCTLLMVSAAAVAVPGVPGYFGAYEYAVSLALGRWGVPRSIAVPHAGLVHLTSYLITTLLGIVFLYREGHSLGSLHRALGEKEREREIETTAS